MALSNFMITLGKTYHSILSVRSRSLRVAGSLTAHVSAVGVATIAYLMKGDVRTGATTFRRNLRHIRGWLEEQGAASSQ